MESNNTQRQAIYPSIFYFGLESNPLKGSIPSRVAIVRTRVFSARASLWEAIPPVFSFGKKRDFVLKTDFEKIRVASLFY